jgi:hypothetical protein
MPRRPPARADRKAIPRGYARSEDKRPPASSQRVAGRRYLSINRHYSRIAREVAVSGPIQLERPCEMIAVVATEHLNILAEKALQVAYGLSENVHILHIE